MKKYLLTLLLASSAALASEPIYFENRTSQPIEFTGKTSKASKSSRYSIRAGDKNIWSDSPVFIVTYHSGDYSYTVTLLAGHYYFFDENRGEIALFEDAANYPDINAEQKKFRTEEQRLLLEVESLVSDFKNTQIYKDCQNESRAYRFFTNSCTEALTECGKSLEKAKKINEAFDDALFAYQVALELSKGNPRNSSKTVQNIQAIIKDFDEKDRFEFDITSLSILYGPLNEDLSTLEKVTACVNNIKKISSHIVFYY